jgi:hypothetical protein
MILDFSGRDSSGKSHCCNSSLESDGIGGRLGVLGKYVDVYWILSNVLNLKIPRGLTLADFENPQR